MGLLSGLLTAVLFFDAMLLMLLVLIQLPKKEAGAGLAFGGAASDALFGAGSGTALSQLTKYAAAIFLGLSVILTVINNKMLDGGSEGLDRELQKQATTTKKAEPFPAAIPSGEQSIAVPPSNTTTDSENTVTVTTEAGSAGGSPAEEQPVVEGEPVPVATPAEEVPKQN